MTKSTDGDNPVHNPMDQPQLDQIKARAAAPDKLPVHGDYKHAVAVSESQADVPALVAEVERLRKALAGTLFDGESITAREAVRTELINMGIRAYVSLDGVKELLEECKRLGDGDVYGVKALRLQLQEVLYAAGDETPPAPDDTPPASPVT